MTPNHGRWEIPPDPHCIGDVRREVAAFAADAGAGEAALTDVQVAVSDAMTNAILHAGADLHGGRLSVEAEDVGDELIVRVCDAGGGTAEHPSCSVLGPRLSMIAALAQVCGVRRRAGGATELSMHFALNPG